MLKLPKFKNEKELSKFYDKNFNKDQLFEVWKSYNIKFKSNKVQEGKIFITLVKNLNFGKKIKSFVNNSSDTIMYKPTKFNQKTTLIITYFNNKNCEKEKKQYNFNETSNMLEFYSLMNRKYKILDAYILLFSLKNDKENCDMICKNLNKKQKYEN